MVRAYFIRYLMCSEDTNSNSWRTNVHYDQNSKTLKPILLKTKPIFHELKMAYTYIDF